MTGVEASAMGRIDAGRGRRGGGWILWVDAAVFLGMGVYLWLLFDPFGLISYRLGYEAPEMWWGSAWRVIRWGWLLLGGCLYVLCRLVTMRRVFARSRRGFLTLLAMFGGAELLIAVAAMAAGPRGFLDGFAVRVKQQVDTGAIRNWLDVQEASLFNGDGRECHTKAGRQTLPDIFKTIEPPIESVRFWQEGEKERYVGMSWGGGFLLWGIVIGPVDMEIPESVSGHGWDREVHKVEDGVYVYAEG